MSDDLLSISVFDEFDFSISMRKGKKVTKIYQK